MTKAQYVLDLATPADKVPPVVVSAGQTLTDGPLLFAAPAGIWTGKNHNANVVPVVANGRVYVASDHQLAVFGLAAEPGKAWRQHSLRRPGHRGRQV